MIREKRTMRKHFIDNLRWMDVFLLIPYHAAQSFNTWGELNYIYFSPNKAISSFIVFFSPFFMPLLFLLAGMICSETCTKVPVLCFFMGTKSNEENKDL